MAIGEGLRVKVPDKGELESKKNAPGGDSRGMRGARGG